MKEEIHSTRNNIFIRKAFIKIFTFRLFSLLQYLGNVLAGQSWLSPMTELGLYHSHKLISKHTGSPQESLPRGCSCRTCFRDLNCILYGKKKNISVIDWPFFRYVSIWRMSVHCENLGAGMAPKAPHIFKVNLPVILTHVDKSALLGKGSIYLKKSVIRTQLYYSHQWFGGVISQRQKITKFTPTISLHSCTSHEKEQWKCGWNVRTHQTAVALWGRVERNTHTTKI